MTEIDLIPQDYRTRQWQQRWLKMAAFVFAGLMLVHAALFVAARSKIGAVEAEVAKLETQQRVSAQQRAELERLTATKAEYDQQLRLLSGLRSGASAEQLFLTVERALESDELWFRDWRFQRAGIVVESVEDAVDTGYFIVVPPDTNSAGAESWRVRTHMTIRGRSRDHSALSAFVKGLFSQPEIDDVHLGRTSMTRVGSEELVDFDLAVVMNTNVAAD